jgi:D-glycero-beta-D-manno-heptose-7-phosphate kinase
MLLDAEFLTRLRSAAPRLYELLDRWHGLRILVVGDLTLDEFMTGEVERISREAPVPIVRHELTRQVPGGGANAVYNFAKLGAMVKVAGLVGKDEQGRTLQEVFNTAGVKTMGILVESDRPTVTKTRISAHSRQSVTQQIVRIDRKSDAPPALGLQWELAEYIRATVDTVDAIVCSDYGDGVLTTPVVEAALLHSRTIVDAQKDLHRYHGATIFTPNLPEAELAVGYSIPDLPTLERAGWDLLAIAQAQYILITRGADGMSLFDRNGEVSHIPAFNRTDVFDVTGAGDTVVAALTLGLAAGGSAWEATILGNLAASLVIRQFGTTTTTMAEIKAALAELVA